MDERRVFMVAPMDFDNEYKLNIEMEQVNENEVFLQVEKEFTYNDIWKARDEYDKFFAVADYYDYEFCTNKLPAYDKWINMIGNEECMVVKKVYVLKFNSLVEAQKEKKRLEKEHDKIIRNKSNKVIESTDVLRGAVIMEPIHKMSREEILELDIEDLGLSVRSYNALRRAGITTVKSLMTPREDMMGVRNLGRKSLEEVLDKLKSLGFELNEENEEAEKIYPGHEKCEQLRRIRKKIAEVNNIKFEPTVCTHNGPCLGTCPVCDAEIRYLDNELQKKKSRGEEIVLVGIAADEIKEAKVNVPEDEEIIEMGMPIAEGGLEFEDMQDEW